jgi:hypothetical protein
LREDRKTVRVGVFHCHPDPIVHCGFIEASQDAVILSPSGLSNAVAGGGYEVIKVLPDHNGERQYRIKSANEPHERVMRESKLEIIGK